jgi:thioredoxin 1
MGLVFYMLSGSGSSSAMKQSSKNVTLVAEKDFDKEVLQSAEPVLVDFFATWCGPCKALAPVVEELAGQFKGSIKFVKVNADEAPTLTRHHQIEGLPTLLLFRDGKVIDTIVGLRTAIELHARLSAVAIAQEALKAPEAGAPLPATGN